MVYLSDFVRDETGANAVEYALILTVVSVALVTTLASIGNSLAHTYNYLATSLAS